MENLIKEIRSKKFKFIKITQVDLKTKKYYGNSVYRRIIRVEEDGVVSITNLIKNKLDIFTRFPSEGNYKLITSTPGWIEKVDCGRYGTKFREVLFLTEFVKTPRQ